jgi:hypothetical protein
VAHCRLNCIARLPMFSRLRLAGESVAAANRERAAYDKLADDRKIVTSVATEDAAKQVPYWLQADPSLNTESALLQRMGLRRHFKVREAVDLWWSTALATLTDAEMPTVRPLSSSSNLPRGQRWNASSKDIVWAIEQRHEAQPQPQQRGGGGAGTADVPASSADAASSSSSSSSSPSSSATTRALAKTGYFAILRRVFRCMLDEFDEEDVRATLEEDWAADSGGRELLSRELFHDGLFQLADVWTAGVSPEEYAAFLRTLLGRIAAGGRFIHEGKISYCSEYEQDDGEDSAAAQSPASNEESRTPPTPTPSPSPRRNKKFAQPKRENFSALCIQTSTRKRQGKRKARKRGDAVVTIQSNMRRTPVERDYTTKKGACVAIQAGARGRRVRVHAARLRIAVRSIQAGIRLLLGRLIRVKNAGVGGLLRKYTPPAGVARYRMPPMRPPPESHGPWLGPSTPQPPRSVSSSMLFLSRPPAPGCSPPHSPGRSGSGPTLRPGRQMALNMSAPGSRAWGSPEAQRRRAHGALARRLRHQNAGEDGTLHGTKRPGRASRPASAPSHSSRVCANGLGRSASHAGISRPRPASAQSHTAPECQPRPFSAGAALLRRSSSMCEINQSCTSPGVAAATISATISTMGSAAGGDSLRAAKLDGTGKGAGACSPTSIYTTTRLLQSDRWARARTVRVSGVYGGGVTDASTTGGPRQSRSTVALWALTRHDRGTASTLEPAAWRATASWRAPPAFAITRCLRCGRDALTDAPHHCMPLLP